MDSVDRKEEERKVEFDRERADAFTVMMKTRGWDLYVQLLNAKIAERMANIFNPTEPGKEFAEQHNKGAIYGMLMARDLPSVTVKLASEATPAGGEEE